MPAVPQPQSGGEAGRVHCLYCGANNFPASAACWQCSRPLKAMPDTPGGTPLNVSPGMPPPSFPGLPLQAAIRPALSESALAPKAAAAMGLIFPLIGLPAGIIFLMLDDPRKTHLGWLMIGWSLAGTVLSVVPTVLLLGPLWAVLRGLMPHPGSPTPSIPGLPTDGSEGLFLLLACLLKV